MLNPHKQSTGLEMPSQTQRKRFWAEYLCNDQVNIGPADGAVLITARLPARTHTL